MDPKSSLCGGKNMNKLRGLYKSLTAVGFVLMITFFVPVSAEGKHLVYDISFDPSSPENLKAGELVKVSYAYSTDEIKGVVVRIVPLSGGKPLPLSSVSAPKVLPMGSGRGMNAFTVLEGPAAISGLKMIMVSTDEGDVVWEKTIPVRYDFKAADPVPSVSLKITRVYATVLEGFHQGECPHTFEFLTYISAEGEGRVNYRWVRSDGFKSPIEFIVFGKARVEQIHTTWTLGQPGETHTGLWMMVEIISPQRLSSNKLELALYCEEEKKSS
jgi:hypothetical protein